MSKGKSDLFGGMFDFNGDGHTDLHEEYIAYKIFEAVTSSEEDEDEDEDEESQ